ncbi:MAG: hypothetical protein ACKO5Z_08245 [Burkholderiaceae bacterium]
MKRFMVVVAALAATSFAAPCYAHGGLAMDQDKCKLTLGRYQMHFAGYQLDAQRSEFCEDIPHVAETIIVLDAVDEVLRDMPIEVIIARRGSSVSEPGAVEFSLPPQVYPKGTLTLRHNFKEAGDYVGLVYAGEKREHQAVFPFSVGKDRSLPFMIGGVALLAVLGGGGYWVGRQRLQRSIDEATKT